MSLIKLYDTWKQVKGVFKKPKLNISFGNWYKSSHLPVWRRGRTIWLGKYKDRKSIITKVWRKPVKVGNLDIPGTWIDGHGWDWTDAYKENHPILSKLFKPYYELPRWCTFYIFNHDLFWKTKWGDYRYEFPPQFTIVFMYWHITFFLSPPKGCTNRQDDYWESILWYIEKRNLEKTFLEMGKWKNLQTGKYTYRLTPEMVENEYKELIQHYIKQYGKEE